MNTHHLSRNIASPSTDARFQNSVERSGRFLVGRLARQVLVGEPTINSARRSD